MARTQGSLELVVVTHGDADKVDGIAQLLEEPGSIGDVWFNGPRELSSSFGVALSPSAAVDRLMAALSSRAAPVNTAFGGRPVVVDPSGPFPRVQLPGGATVTVLGPSRKQLAALRKAWNDRGKRRPFEPVDAPERVVAEDEATTPEQLEEVPVRAPQGTSETEPRVRRRVRFGSDRAPANGSSIVVLFEHEQRSVLLPGDAHAGPLLDAVRRLAVERGVAGLFVDVFVLPHGGSSGNVTPELLRLLEAGTYAVCSSGAYFRHPDPETIELIAHERPGSAIAFNYRSKVTERWADPAIAERYGLRTHFPEPGHDGIVLTLEPTAVSH
jgi:hypothetical protein